MLSSKIMLKLRTLYNELREGNLKQYLASEQLIQAISNNANDIATAVKTGIKEIDLQKAEKRKLNKNVLNVRSELLICGIIRYTLDGKHFWQYYQSKQILEIFEKLLESTPDVKEVPPTDN